MKHEFMRNVGLCAYCRFWCPNCNDCKCDGNDETTKCPNFDTKAGTLRPSKVSAH